MRVAAAASFRTLRVYAALSLRMARNPRTPEPQRSQRKAAKRRKGNSPRPWFGLTLPRVLTCASLALMAGHLRMARHKDEDHIVFTSNLLKRNTVGACTLSSRALSGRPFRLPLFETPRGRSSSFPFSDFRLTPHYPAKSPLDDVLLKVVPGADEYVTEKYAFEIMPLLKQWSVDSGRHRPRSPRGKISRCFHRSHFPASSPGSRAAFGQRRRGLTTTFREGCHPWPRALSARDGKLSGSRFREWKQRNSKSSASRKLRAPRQCSTSTFVMTWWARERIGGASSAWDIG